MSKFIMKCTNIRQEKVLTKYVYWRIYTRLILPSSQNKLNSPTRCDFVLRKKTILSLINKKNIVFSLLYKKPNKLFVKDRSSIGR